MIGILKVMFSSEFDKLSYADQKVLARFYIKNPNKLVDLGGSSEPKKWIKEDLNVAYFSYSIDFSVFENELKGMEPFLSRVFAIASSAASMSKQFLTMCLLAEFHSSTFDIIPTYYFFQVVR